MATPYTNHHRSLSTIQKPHYVQSSRIPLNPPRRTRLYIHQHIVATLLFVKKEALLNLKKKKKKEENKRKDEEKAINERDSESDTRAQTDRLVDIVLQSEFFSRRYWNLASLSRFQSGQSQRRNTLIDNGFRLAVVFHRPASNKCNIIAFKFDEFRF